MKTSVFVVALALALGGLVGCEPKENKITWMESTGTITKSTQVGEGTFTWVMEIATDKGPVPVNIPGPCAGQVGKKVKLKYNQADPSNYQLEEELIKGI